MTHARAEPRTLKEEVMESDESFKERVFKKTGRELKDIPTLASVGIDPTLVRKFFIVCCRGDRYIVDISGDEGDQFFAPNAYFKNF